MLDYNKQFGFYVPDIRIMLFIDIAISWDQIDEIDPGLFILKIWTRK